MIRLRAKARVPETLKSEKVKKTKKRIAAKVHAKETITDKDFTNYWIEDDVRLKLWRYQYRKCCYCERKRDPRGEPDIEHFRPKTKAEDMTPGYWWLAYNWDNLFFSCKRCNKKKSTRFPLLKGRRAKNPKSKVKESPIFPHPVDENPEDFIDFIWDYTTTVPTAWPVGRDKDDRGSKTIKILDLDDHIIAEERGRSLSLLKGLAAKMNAAEHLFKSDAHFGKGEIDRVEKNIKRQTQSDNEYAGFRRAFFRSNGLGAYVSNDL